MVTKAQNKRAFKALTHAIIMSIFGESPDVHVKGKVNPNAVNDLDGAVVQKGLDIIMLSNRPDLGLESLQRSGFIFALLPEVENIVGFGGKKEGHKDLWDHTKKVVLNTPARLPVRWAALFHDIGKPFSFRRENGKVTFHGHEYASVRLFDQISNRTVLFPDRQFRNYVSRLIEILGRVEEYDKSWSDSAVRRLRSQVYSNEQWVDLLDLARADCTTSKEHKRLAIMSEIDDLKFRSHELIARELEQNKNKLPKGLGLIISKELNLQGRALGNAMKILSDAVSNPKINLSASCDSQQFVEFLKQKKDLKN